MNRNIAKRALLLAAAAAAILAFNACGCGNNKLKPIVIDRSYLAKLSDKWERQLFAKYWDETVYLAKKGDVKAGEAIINFLGTRPMPDCYTRSDLEEVAKAVYDYDASHFWRIEKTWGQRPMEKTWGQRPIIIA